MKLLLKNGKVFDYKTKLNDKYDILIEAGLQPFALCQIQSQHQIM